MGWLAGKRIAAEVAAKLGASIDGGAVGSLVVAFDSKLAARLATNGHNVTFVSDNDRERSRATTPALSLSDFLEPTSEVSEHQFAGAVIVGAAARPNGAAELLKFGRMIARDRACKMVLVDRGQRHVASKTALLGGVTQLEQTVASRVVITSGTVLPPVSV